MVSHIVQAVFAFTFPIVYDAVVFCRVIIRFCCVIRHESIPNPLPLPYLAHHVTTIASARPEFFQPLLVAILLPGLMYGCAIKKHMIYMRHKKRIVTHLRPFNIYGWKKCIYTGSICVAIGQTRLDLRAELMTDIFGRARRCNS